MRNRTLTLTGLLAGALLLTACGDDSDTAAGNGGGSGPSSSASSSSAAEFNDADVTFVTGMKPHHAQAVEMSEMILAADPTPDVAALAERVKAAQAPEIDQLDEMIEHFGAEDGAGGAHDAHGGGPSAMHGGPTAMHGGGMMTDEQMEQLDAVTGVEASRMWLEMMIDHHKGAIDAAETELSDGEYPPALELARSISVSQAAEIDEMERLLTQL